MIDENLDSEPDDLDLEDATCRSPDDDLHRVRRRTILKALAALGAGSVAFRRALAAQAAAAEKVTPEMIKQAEWIAGLDLTDKERESAAKEVQERLRSFQQLREVNVGYEVPPALVFVPAPGLRPAPEAGRNRARPLDSPSPSPQRPQTDEALAFLSLAEMSALIRSRKIGSTELTKLYLARLKRFDPLLKCVVTLTEELAFQQAARPTPRSPRVSIADRCTAFPGVRKDLIAYPGYPTTWGASAVQGPGAQREGHGRRQAGRRWRGTRGQADPGRPGDGRPVVRRQDPQPLGPAARLERLIGRFRRGCRRGTRRLCDWQRNTGQHRLPVPRLRCLGSAPTFGRVSRHGCMSLAWSMDKLGPIARSIEDCALVFDAIHGHDGLDLTAIDQPFEWPPRVNFGSLKIGYVEEAQRPSAEREELKVLRELGFELVPIKLPERLPPRRHHVDAGNRGGGGL